MLENVPWDINKACCFTGHRNRDLPFGGDRDQPGMKRLVSTIHLHIEQAIKDGYDTFITGMAPGVDLICAEIVNNLIERQDKNVRLICAIPYKDQCEQEFSDPVDRYIYNLILDNCSHVYYISDKKDRSCYKKRNTFMVKNSSLVIGVLKSKKSGSGTQQTINMAEKAGKELRIISLDSNPVFYIDK